MITTSSDSFQLRSGAVDRQNRHQIQLFKSQKFFFQFFFQIVMWLKKILFAIFPLTPEINDIDAIPNKNT